LGSYNTFHHSFVRDPLIACVPSFCTVKSLITSLVDEFPRLLRPRRKMFSTLVVIVHFLIGLSMITSGGLYIFQLMDNFSASGVSFLIVVLSEVTCFGWVYGDNNI